MPMQACVLTVWALVIAAARSSDRLSFCYPARKVKIATRLQSRVNPSAAQIHIYSCAGKISRSSASSSAKYAHLKGSCRISVLQRRARIYRSESPLFSDQAFSTTSAGLGPGKYNFKAVIAYKGTAYKGWQIQNGKSLAPTIQDKIEAAISTVKDENRSILKLQGAGRTDAGVHAYGQVCNFFSNKLTPDSHKLVLGVNANLPPDIRVKSIQRVSADFSARYSSLSKLYAFHLHTGRVADPFQLGLSQHIFKPLNVVEMRKAASMFAGTHDFTQFSSLPSTPWPISPVKTLTRVQVLEQEAGLQIFLEGSGFLYNQCRHIVGCLIEVGLGHMLPSNVQRLLKIGSKERPGLKHRGWTLAAAEGLYLMGVRYPPHEDFTKLLYPELPHDEFGRVSLQTLPLSKQKHLIAKMKQLQAMK